MKFSKLAKSWLDTCLHHQRDMPVTNPAEMNSIPTRLLKAHHQRPHSSSLYNCALRNREDFRPRTPYLALGHCWGGRQYPQPHNLQPSHLPLHSPALLPSSQLQRRAPSRPPASATPTSGSTPSTSSRTLPTTGLAKP